MTKCYFVFLDTEMFPLPSQNAIILDMFFHVKDEIEKALQPVANKIYGSPSFIIVVIKPDRVSFDYLVDDKEVEALIQKTLLEKMNLTKIAEKINSKTNN